MPAKRRYSESRTLERVRSLCEGHSVRRVGRRTATHPETARRFLIGMSKPSVRFLANLCAVKCVPADRLVPRRDER